MSASLWILMLFSQKQPKRPGSTRKRPSCTRKGLQTQTMSSATASTNRTSKNQRKNCGPPSQIIWSRGTRTWIWENATKASIDTWTSAKSNTSAKYDFWSIFCWSWWSFHTTRSSKNGWDSSISCKMTEATSSRPKYSLFSRQVHWLLWIYGKLLGFRENCRRQIL